MKFNELSTFLSSAAILYSDVSQSRRDEIAEIAAVLLAFPGENSTAIAKRLTKSGRAAGVGLYQLQPLIQFCLACKLPKYAKALSELVEITVRYDLSTVAVLQSALEANLATEKLAAPKPATDVVVVEYLNRLSSAGSFAGGVGEVIAAIEADKKVTVEDMRHIASRTLNVELSKGRTRSAYVEELRSRFIVLDREERKLAASRSVSKPWSTS
jgi:hypothetical protein